MFRNVHVCFSLNKQNRKSVAAKMLHPLYSQKFSEDKIMLTYHTKVKIFAVFITYYKFAY